MVDKLIKLYTEAIILTFTLFLIKPALVFTSDYVVIGFTFCVFLTMFTIVGIISLTPLYDENKFNTVKRSLSIPIIYLTILYILNLIGL